MGIIIKSPIQASKLTNISHGDGIITPNLITLYKNNKINFAGKYSILTWPVRSAGSTESIMIDNSTGVCYQVPIDYNNTNISCMDDSYLIDETLQGRSVFFRENISLLVTRSYDEYSSDIQTIVTYYFYKWDESKMKFIFIKAVKNFF